MTKRHPTERDIQTSHSFNTPSSALLACPLHNLEKGNSSTEEFRFGENKKKKVSQISHTDKQFDIFLKQLKGAMTKGPFCITRTE